MMSINKNIQGEILMTTMEEIVPEESIKGIDKNIVIKQDNITFTINGKDIENIDGNLDLSLEIEELKESILNKELKEKVENAVVLNFKNEGELPGKLLVEVNATNEIKEKIGEKI